MTASLLASFVIFIVTGFYELFLGKSDFLTGQPVVRYSVYIILFVNSIYYYYVAAFTEMNEQTVKALRSAPRWEWCIRVVNQTVLFGLWFLLHFSWAWFGAGLIVLYLTYILWDRVTWACFTKHHLVCLDVVGLLISALFLAVRSRIEGTDAATQMTMGFFLGIIIALYLVIVVVGFRICKFNPFSSHYLTRPQLH